MTYFRHAAIVVALLAGADAASAQTTVITREPVESQTVVTTGPVQLTPFSDKRSIVRSFVSVWPQQRPQSNTASALACRQARSSIQCRKKLRSRCRQSGPTNTWW